MSGSTSVPSPTLTAAGYVTPPETSILVGVLADLNAAFGGALIVTDSAGNPETRTPQGQIATTATASIGNQNDAMLSIFNGVDPALATGRMQDGIARIYFISRKPALATTVDVDCNGIPGTVIPAAVVVRATDGNDYVAQSGGIIAANSHVSLPFACAVTGPIACSAGTVTEMRQLIPGWDAVTNPADGVTGRDQETPTAFEARRAASVAGNSNGTLPAILGSVLGVAGVIDALVIDNATTSPVTLDGVTVPASGLYVCVSGGSDANVASAIWRKKPPGIPYCAGNVTVTVVDPSPDYGSSPPSYTVKFQRAAPAVLYVAVNIVASAAVPSNAGSLIGAAVVAALSTGEGLRIGERVYASRFYAPVAALGSWALIRTIKLGVSTTLDASFTGTLVGAALTVSSVSGAIVVGAWLVGASIPDGVRIVSGSGTSWVVAPLVSGTTGPEAMGTVTPGADSAAIGQAHIAVLAAANTATTVT